MNDKIDSMNNKIDRLIELCLESILTVDKFIEKKLIVSELVEDGIMTISEGGLMNLNQKSFNFVNEDMAEYFLDNTKFKKVKHTTGTFENVEHIFDSYQYDISENIASFLGKFYSDEASCTSVMSNEEGNKLIIGLIMKARTGLYSDKFRITIEKLIQE